MKKVLVVTESESVWGAERSLLQLARFAEANEVSLHFLISTNSPLGTDLDRLGLPYLRHSFANHPALDASGSLSNAGISEILREFVAVVGGAARIWRKLRGFDSVLVFSIWQAPETILGSWLARIPVDIDLHETFGNARAMRLVGIISKASRRVIVPSFVLAARSGLRLSDRVSVIPRPVDFKFEDPLKRHFPLDSPMIVGVFGQIQPHKNVLEIAKAVSTAGGHIRLMVVGGNSEVADRTDYELEVRRFVSSMANESLVVDFVTEVTDVMRECEVVVNASEHEAFGRTIVEAVSVGSYPVSVGDWGPKETILALGVGSVLDGIEELGEVLSELLVKRRTAPLLDAIPPTLNAYKVSTVAQRYFSLISRVMK